MVKIAIGFMALKKILLTVVKNVMIKLDKATPKKRLDVRIIQKKRVSWETLFKYEEDYLWKSLRDKADKVFKAWIRNRDKGKWCVSKGADWCLWDDNNACHFIEAWFYSHRWDEDNVHWWCFKCNRIMKQEHGIFYDRWMRIEYWNEFVDNMLLNRHKDKPTIKEIEEIIIKYSV